MCACRCLALRTLRTLCDLLLVALFLANASAAEPKRVLIVHSFGTADPPFTLLSTAFRTELVTKMGEGVDCAEVWLDLARYTSAEAEETLVEFVAKRKAKSPPDIVVPMGLPAARFIIEHRDKMFPKTTAVIHTGIDHRRLPAGALEGNSTFVGPSFDPSSAVRDILELSPNTTNIAVVLGASQLEKYWKQELLHDYGKFTNHVNFTFFDDLSFNEMLQHVKAMPPRSFILYFLLVRDASGAAHNGDEALRRLHEVASAPMGGLFLHQLGLGIVGGRLLQTEVQGTESARIAFRILAGEPATNIPPKIVDLNRPTYDWREMKRWKIDEKRLPVGSTVRFRDVSLWRAYPRGALAVLIIFLVQAVSILALVLNITKSRRMEVELRESQQRMTLAANAASLGMIVWDTSSRQMWTSSKWKEIHGYSAEDEVTYGNFLSRIHPEDLGVVENAIKDAFNKKSEFLLQHRIIRPDGNVRWISKHGRIEPVGRNNGLRFLGVAIDITEHVNAESAAREVSGRLINAQEDERKRIARDLHDDVNQRLAILSLDADMLGRINQEPEAKPLIEEITSHVKSLATEIHNLSYKLHPAKLEQLGLVAATRALCSEQSRAWSMPIDFVQAGVPRELNTNTALVIYRITQEALHNIGKHSKATHAQVKLTRQGDVISLSINDDGQGFDMKTVSHHQGLGLLGMRERVHLAHGHMEIQSAPGKGTSIEVRVPLFEETATLKA